MNDDLAKTTADLADRIQDFTEMKSANGKLSDDDYYRWLVPISKHWEAVYDSAFGHTDASREDLMAGRESPYQRGLTVLKKVLEPWPFPAIAGEVALCVLPVYDQNLFVKAFSVIPPQLRVAARLLESKPAAVDALPDDSLKTLAGEVVRRDELTEEDRPSSEWASICGFGDDTFRNRMLPKRKGPTWRIVESSSQRYRIHIDDLLPNVRSKRLRDDRLKAIAGHIPD